MLSRIHLVRHGETAWSLAGRHTGRTNIPLTPRGEEQARQLGERLRQIPFAEVLTSPLERARRTCEAAGFGAVMRIDPDLSEWDYGEYEGVTSAEIRSQHPRWSLFRDGCPGGESPQQVASRADRVARRLRALAGNAAVFSHGHFLRALAVRWIDLAIVEGEHLLLQTASVSILAFDHQDPDEPAVALWNEGLNEGLKELPSR